MPWLQLALAVRDAEALLSHPEHASEALAQYLHHLEVLRSTCERESRRWTEAMTEAAMVHVPEKVAGLPPERMGL